MSIDALPCRVGVPRALLVMYTFQVQKSNDRSGKKGDDSYKIYQLCHASLEQLQDSGHSNTD